MANKKRHHYVPKAYLNAFTDIEGKVLVYRKDEPSKVLRQRPDSTGFEGYYYSQPTPEGEMDHNRLEDTFSKIEGLWPAVVKRMSRREDVNDSLGNIFEFILLQKVRVPASRDATEAKLAAQVHQTIADMATLGELSPIPPELVGLLDDIVVSIDPHKSIHGMLEDIHAARHVFSRIGLCAVHNLTNIPFLTSDNPVIWFDPAMPPEDAYPYAVSPDGPVLLFFPISPTLLLVGADLYMPHFAMHGLIHSEVTDEAWVVQVNEEVCKYAYRAVYANTPGFETMIQSFAETSPV